MATSVPQVAVPRSRTAASTTTTSSSSSSMYRCGSKGNRSCQAPRWLRFSPILRETVSVARSSQAHSHKEKVTHDMENSFRVIQHSSRRRLRQLSASSDFTDNHELSETDVLSIKPTIRQQPIAREKNTNSCTKIGSNFCWSMEEHTLFVDAFLLFGTDWKSVAAYVPTRSIRDCEMHAEEYFASSPPPRSPTSTSSSSPNSHSSCRLRQRPSPFSRHALEWRP